MAKRLFIAVRPPDEVLDAVDEAVVPARRSMVGPRWTTRDQWHLTLHFLGAVGEERIDGLMRALDGVSRVQPFPARLGGGGAFPRPARAKVVWLGVQGGAEPMVGLAGAVGDALRPLGFEPEERGYHPHLTLARLRAPGDVAPAVEALGEEAVGPAFVVREVLLYESWTGPGGSRYERLGAVALEG